MGNRFFNLSDEIPLLRVLGHRQAEQTNYERDSANFEVSGRMFQRRICQQCPSECRGGYANRLQHTEGPPFFSWNSSWIRGQ